MAQSKKPDFKTIGIDGIFQRSTATVEASAQQEPATKPAVRKTAATGAKRGRKPLPPAQHRETFIVSKEQAAKLRKIAYKETGKTGQLVRIMDVVAEAFDMYIKAYEKENGSI